MKTATEVIGTLAAKAGCLSLSPDFFILRSQKKYLASASFTGRKTQELMSQTQGMGAWM